MKIFIAGSMSFAKEFIWAKEILEKLGFETDFAPDTHMCAENPSLLLNEDLEHCERNDILRSCMDVQEKCDAILLLNYPKDGVEGYIGSNSLMELGLSYYLGHKIFLLHPLPPPEVARYHTEVVLMKPVILEGNIESITSHIKS